MPHDTYWLPYPALLNRLGFISMIANYWFRCNGDSYQNIGWGGASESASTLFLTVSGAGTVFSGELQSEEEFLTLLRQVRWTK